MEEEYDLQKMILRTKEVLSVLDNKFKKPVCQYTLKGKLIAEYNSMLEASILTEDDIASISRICSKKQKPKNFLWKYKNLDYLIPKDPLDKLLKFL